MSDTTTELERLDRAFAGNLLLATFSSEIRGLMEPGGEIIELSVGERVLSRGQDVDWSYFPFGTTMISLVVELTDGRSVQVASIGREGAVGGIVSCGHAPAFAQAQVMVGGPAMRLPMQALEAGQTAVRLRRATSSAVFPTICWQKSCSRRLATPSTRSSSAPRAGC